MAAESVTAGPMADLTAFQRDLLVTVARMDEPHGLGVKAELEHHYNEQIQHGRLYPNLDDLVEKGLIEKGTKDRRTNWYSITRRGLRELEADLEWRDVDV